MQNARSNLHIETLFAWGAMTILAGAFWLLISNLLWGDWTYDQGFYFVVARLMDQGFTPYTEIHMSEQPLMAWTAHFAFQLFNSIWGMQAAMVAYAMLGLAALMGLGRLLNGKLTGLLAGLFLAAHFEFFSAARLVNPETTSMSIALVAIACALHYRASQKRYWLIASAAAMAASFLLKLFMVVVIPLIALILILYPATHLNLWDTLKQKKDRIFYDYLLWFGLMGLILVGVWVAVGLPGWYEQSVVFYINRNAIYEYDLTLNFGEIWQLLANWPVLLILALWGLGRSFIQFKKFGWIPVVWASLTLLFLMSFTPLRGKHLIMLLPPLALLAAIGTSHLVKFPGIFPDSAWKKRKRLKTGFRPVIKWGSGVVVVIILIFLAVEMITPFKKLEKPAKPLVDEKQQILIDALEKFTSPKDCLITDDPYVAYVSNRLPPPWLSNMSYARFRTGSLDQEDLIEIGNTYNCQVMVPTFARLKNSNREFYDLAKAHYLRVWVVDGAEIMIGKPLATATPDIPIKANFDNQAELVGADWLPDSTNDERKAYLSLYWKKLEKPFAENYKIFVQLRNDAGQTVISADHEVFDGLIPAQTWRFDTITKDTSRLVIPPDMMPGQYTLYVGLYNPATLERIPILNDTSGENAAVIPGIVIR